MMKKNQMAILEKLSVNKMVVTEAELVRTLIASGALEFRIHKTSRLAVEEEAVAEVEVEVAVRKKRSVRNVRKSLDNNHNHMLRVMQSKSKICHAVQSTHNNNSTASKTSSLPIRRRNNDSSTSK